MQLYPAIDILDGKVVRLTKGSFTRAQVYADDAVSVACAYEAAGAKFLHIVDLDGARTGHPINTEVVRKIRAQTNLSLQVGGGLRSVAAAQSLIQAGVHAVVVGSIAVTEPQTTRQLLQELGGDKVILALDCRHTADKNPLLAIEGWMQQSTKSLWNLIDRYRNDGIAGIICTDIERDGTGVGANMEFYRRILARYPQIKLQASGGVSSLSELTELAEIGVEACILGKSLYEKKIDLGQALKASGVTC